MKHRTDEDRTKASRDNVFVAIFSYDLSCKIEFDPTIWITVKRTSLHIIYYHFIKLASKLIIPYSLIN